MAGNIKCYRCGQSGHMARCCYMKNSNYRYKENKSVMNTSQKKTISPSVDSNQKIASNSSKRKSNISTNFESLANELLFDLFEYLSSVDILCAFYDLNFRFNTLILSHSRDCYLNFQSVSTRDLQTVCYQRIPSIASRIVSIRISNEKDYSKRNSLLRFYHTNLPKFINLQSITLCSIHSESLMDTIMFEWTFLPYLTHIKLIKYDEFVKHKGTTRLSNSIWTLPKLTHCYLDSDHCTLCMPTKTSSSIEYLSISGQNCRLTDVKQILKQTPKLRALSIQHRDLDDNDFLTSPIPLIEKFKLYETRSPPVMMNLLQNMINLNHLTIETCFINLDGYQWEDIINRYLPNLTIFRLKMQIQFTGDKNNENQLDLLIDSFRTDFWLKKHQWFIRSHYHFNPVYSDILLYTLPLIFTNCSKTMMDCPSKTTAFIY